MLSLYGVTITNIEGASQEEGKDQPVLQSPFLLRLREGSEVPKATQHNGSQAERELEPSQDPSPHSCCPSVGHCQGPGQDSLAILGQPGGWAEPGRTEAHSHPPAFCSQEACQILFGLRVGAQALLGGWQGACVWHRDAGRSALTPPAQCPGPRAPSPTPRALHLPLDI